MCVCVHLPPPGMVISQVSIGKSSWPTCEKANLKPPVKKKVQIKSNVTKPACIWTNNRQDDRITRDVVDVLIQKNVFCIFLYLIKFIDVLINFGNKCRDAFGGGTN